MNFLADCKIRGWVRSSILSKYLAKIINHVLKLFQQYFPSVEATEKRLPERCDEKPDLKGLCFSNALHPTQDAKWDRVTSCCSSAHKFKTWTWNCFWAPGIKFLWFTSVNHRVHRPNHPRSKMQPTQLQTCHSDVAFPIVAWKIMTWNFLLEPANKEGVFETWTTSTIRFLIRWKAPMWSSTPELMHFFIQWLNDLFCCFLSGNPSPLEKKRSLNRVLCYLLRLFTSSLLMCSPHRRDFMTSPTIAQKQDKHKCSTILKRNLYSLLFKVDKGWMAISTRNPTQDIFSSNQIQQHLAH